MKPEHNYYELWDNAMEKETKKIYMKDKLHKCGVLRILYSTCALTFTADYKVTSEKFFG